MNKIFQISKLGQTTIISKALADETRLRIMGILEKNELCACQIIEVFELANSTISKHLSLLKQAGLIQSRKEGRWIFFSWSESTEESISQTHKWLKKMLMDDEQIDKDTKAVRKIIKIDPVELCRRQNGKDCC